MLPITNWKTFLILLSEGLQWQWCLPLPLSMLSTIIHPFTHSHWGAVNSVYFSPLTQAPHHFHEIITGQIHLEHWSASASQLPQLYQMIQCLTHIKPWTLGYFNTLIALSLKSQWHTSCSRTATSYVQLTFSSSPIVIMPSHHQSFHLIDLSTLLHLSSSSFYFYSLIHLALTITYLLR